ncbi:unnamed protein product, partial [Adineta steineri]
ILSSQTLTRLTYTINLNGSDLPSLAVTQPLTNSILLSNLYTNIPYKRFSIYIDGNAINLTSSTTLAMLNQALRTSWSMANSNLFSATDVLIPSINSLLLTTGQSRIDYMIGLRSGDIGDYSQPSERLYTQIFNQTGLQTLVYTRYILTGNNQAIINNDQRANLPFYQRSGPFYGLDWWIILILVVGILTIWLIICLICYICCRRRSINISHHQNYKTTLPTPPPPPTTIVTTRQIDILTREQNYHPVSLSSLTLDEQQRISPPELQERNPSVVVQDIHHVSKNESVYATGAAPYPSSRRSISVIDLQDQPSTIEFRRPHRTSRSVSPSNTFRYILPFNSHREEKQRNHEQTSLGNRQDVPITVTKSPMYSDEYL